MSIKDKLIQITENLKKIYDKGFKDGSQSSDNYDQAWDDGYNAGYDTGYNDGYDSGYMQGLQDGSGSGGEMAEGYCPNCGHSFVYDPDGPATCPECGTDVDEWNDGMRTAECPSCGNSFEYEAEGPAICTECGTNIDQWYEENESTDYPE